MESRAEKQMVSEMPRTPLSWVPTPPPLAKESKRHAEKLLEAPPHTPLAVAARSANNTVLLPTSTNSPSRPAVPIPSGSSILQFSKQLLHSTSRHFCRRQIRLS